MKCHRCPTRFSHSGSNLRVVATGKVLKFCCPLCRSLFMRTQLDGKYRTMN